MDFVVAAAGRVVVFAVGRGVGRGSFVVGDDGEMPLGLRWWIAGIFCGWEGKNLYKSIWNEWIKGVPWLVPLLVLVSLAGLEPVVAAVVLELLELLAVGCNC